MHAGAPQKVISIIRRPHFIVLASLVLCAGALLVSRPHSQAELRPAVRATHKPFSIIAIPDTQAYTQKYPQIFESQTEWIAAHKTERNIVYVTHEGDIVDSLDDTQWKVADRAMARLDGVVPYGIAPGNHDLDRDGSAAMYAVYFPLSRLSKASTWGGSFSDNSELYRHGGLMSDKNNYHLFTAGGQDFLAINLEFCPPAPVVQWTSDLLSKYARRRALITTHSFTNAAGERQDNSMCARYHSQGTYAGVELWDKLITQDQHSNIAFFLSGHDIWTISGGARRTDWVAGRPVHQLLANYQDLGQGGDGYLRIMTFDMDKKTVRVQTYSPYLDAYRTDPDNDFSLPL